MKAELFYDIIAFLFTIILLFSIAEKALTGECALRFRRRTFCRFRKKIFVGILCRSFIAEYFIADIVAHKAFAEFVLREFAAVLRTEHNVLFIVQKAHGSAISHIIVCKDEFYFQSAL